MRKLLLGLGLVFGLGVASSAIAQEADYSNLCKWDEQASPRRIMRDSRGVTIAERIVQSILITGATVDGQGKNYTMPIAGINRSTPVSQINFDRTSEPAVVMTKGDVISVQPSVWQLEWMHYYLYIDYNHNGQFDTDELVSFTHYRAVDGGTFVNSAGDVFTSGNIRNNGRLPDFTVSPDAKSGLTRARFKCDWNSKDPCGDAKLADNRGTICDFMVDIKGAEVATPTAAFTMDVDTDGGSVELVDMTTGAAVADPSKVALGTILELRVTPNEGFEVSELKVNNVDKKASLKDGKLNLIADDDTQITVKFAKKTYRVYVTKFAAAAGTQLYIRDAESGDPIALDATIQHGTKIKLYAEAPHGYKFSNFVVNGENRLEDIESAVDGLELTVTQDLRIMMRTAEALVAFSYNYDRTMAFVSATTEAGKVVENHSQVRQYSVIHLKVEPNAGYKLVGIREKSLDMNLIDMLETVDGQPNVFELQVEESDIEITLEFAETKGIEELSALGYRVATAKELISVTGLNAGETVEVYQLSGTLVAKAVATDSAAKFSVEKGVYLVKVGKTAAKVVVD